ncbi:Uncharacterised protein [Serratia marcescens]|nr:Uncharacterised protein [Serratia marcescens]CAI2083552.1 Uncharacterised protein [Serratia marcescens]CAI2096897.1 Uncharacterised protein [Serratia marcescens]
MGYFWQKGQWRRGAREGRRKYVTDIDGIAIKLLLSSFHVLVFINYFSNRYLLYFLFCQILMFLLPFSLVFYFNFKY